MIYCCFIFLDCDILILWKKVRNSTGTVSVQPAIINSNYRSWRKNKEKAADPVPTGVSNSKTLVPKFKIKTIKNHWKNDQFLMLGLKYKFWINKPIKYRRNISKRLHSLNKMFWKFSLRWFISSLCIISIVIQSQIHLKIGAE